MRHYLRFVPFALVAGVLLLCGHAPWPARAGGNKKGPGDEAARLREVVQRLQRELHEREQRIDQLQAQLRKQKFGPDPDDARIRGLQKQLREKDETIGRLRAEAKKAHADDKKDDTRAKDQGKELAKLRRAAGGLETVREARYVHVMLLRPKKDAAEDEVKALLDRAPQALSRLPGVRGVWVGRPADTANEGYRVGIVLLFDDAEAMRRFQRDPGQKRFVAGLKQAWEPPTVHDLLP